ncbi:MAG: thioredoxin [bacterium]
MIKYLKDGEVFEEVIKEGDYIVDFYADWCGPCKMLGPVLESLENVNVLKVDVDNFQAIANKFAVMSIPTIIYFKDGIEIQKEIGFRNKEQIMGMIK